MLAAEKLRSSRLSAGKGSVPKLGGAGLWDVGLLLLLLRASKAFLWTSTSLVSAAIAPVYNSFAVSLISAAGSSDLRLDDPLDLDLCRLLALPPEWRRLDLLLPTLIQWLCILEFSVTTCCVHM